tara:strand:- start:936 stop:1637 length:702 start_codon:yes stop_codon:yes gene_type:complete
MALPRVNSSPKYDTVIPSLKKTIHYRPYLVKEEKVLMMALESNDNKQMLSAVVDTIQSCVTEDIEREKLTSFDVEWLFTKIRSKSVGETSTVNIKCDECEESNEVTVDLNELKLDDVKDPEVIKLNDQISIKMKYPKYDELMQYDFSETNVETSFNLLGKCIESVMTENENFNLQDESQEEVREFIESLTSQQLSSMQVFLDNMPKVRYDLNYTCSGCGKQKQNVMEGLQSFL